VGEVDNSFGGSESKGPPWGALTDAHADKMSKHRNGIILFN